jgi:hypothetical protein
VSEDKTPSPVDLQSEAERLLLRELSPPAVLVDEGGDIAQINGRTGKYVEPAAGKTSWNIHVMARQGLRAPIEGALRTAAAQSGPVELHAVPIDAGDENRRVDVGVRVVRQAGSLKGLRLIVFRDAPTRSWRRSRAAQADALELPRARGGAGVSGGARPRTRYCSRSTRSCSASSTTWRWRRATCATCSAAPASPPFSWTGTST